MEEAFSVVQEGALQLAYAPDSTPTKTDFNIVLYTLHGLEPGERMWYSHPPSSENSVLVFDEYENPNEAGQITGLDGWIFTIGPIRFETHGAGSEWELPFQLWSQKHGCEARLIGWVGVCIDVYAVEDGLP